jgi:radical SAM superfamily enzyme YgiQ (UPF0313 family)
MRITLIRCHEFDSINTRLPGSINKAQGVVPPLGLLYLGSNLDGHDVQIVDAVLNNLTTDEIADRVQYWKSDIVGITAMTPTIRGALEVAKLIHEKGIPVIIGGAHCSVYPIETVELPYVDYVVCGDGEVPLKNLLDALQNKTSTDIIGIITKNWNGGIYIQKNLDDLNDIDWDLINVLDYNSIAGEDTNCTIMATRGCPFNCGFCLRTPETRLVRYRSIDRVIKEIEVLKSKGIKEILFYDDTLTANRKYIMAMCKRLREVNIKWSGPTRVDRVDLDLLKVMKSSGCKMLRFGVESGDINILKLMNKGTNISTIYNAFKIAKEVGIETFAYFIIGYATESEVTMKRTIKLAKMLDPDMVMFTIATPLPLTDLNKYSPDSDYWLKYMRGETSDRAPILHPLANKYVKKAYREFYLRPSYIWKRIKKIKSFGDLKKNIVGAIGILKV